MKRFICLILILSLCFCLFACSNFDPNIRVPVEYYYRTREIHYNGTEGVISSETRDCFGYQEDYAYLVEDYLKGPTTEKCISPFPAGITLEQLDLVKDKVLIVVSSHLSMLSGSELTVACMCLGKTLLDMTGMKAVRISAKDDLLDGNPYITITNENFLLTDANDSFNPAE